MAREYTMVMERGEGGYLVASAPSLSGCPAPAHGLDELRDRIREAIELCRKAGAQDEDERIELVGIQRIVV